MSIVQVNVSQTVAPTPSRYQSTGVFLTQGGTTLSTGVTSLLTQLSDLQGILAGKHALTSLVSGPGLTNTTITATTTSPHGLTGTVSLTIVGAKPQAYNGTYSCTVTGLSTFTYVLPTNPGTNINPGSYLVPGSNAPAVELTEMATTFFAQGSSQAVYVLELGSGSVSSGVAELVTWLAANPGIFYAYLVPREWDGVSQYLSLIASYESPTSQTYFFTTTTSGTYTDYTPLMKCVMALVEAPTIGATEFSLASWFWNWLHNAPSGTNKITPASNMFLFGVTPYPTAGNSVLLAELAAANVNVVGTGAEGGISNTILQNGTTMDGNDANQYWYSADWVQIQIGLQISNAVINGSNNPINPLYYNQNGINFLQQIGAQVLTRAISFGLATGTVAQTALDGTTFTTNYENGDYDDQCVINAVPFVTYSQENPGDYQIGRYAGFAIVYLPQNGFRQIIFNINISQFIAP